MNAPRSRAFSLIELLAATAIVAALFALLFSGGKKWLNSTRSVQCLGKMKALGAAAHMYIADNNGGLPHTSENANWMVNLAPYLATSGELKKNDPFTTVFLCPDDPARAPRQFRTSRYNAATLSTTATVLLLPKKITGVASPATLAMFFCIAFTGNRQLEIWTYDNAIWRENVDNANPPSPPGVNPRPHSDGRAVNIVFYDGHAAAVPYPLPPATFHFDGK